MTLNPLRPAFEFIHESLYIHTPKSPSSKSNDSDPDTILFLAWGNAPRKNIIKYTNHYQEIYPNARIILFLTSFSDILLHHPTRQAEPLSPAIQAIRAAGEGSKTLVHLYSNAGSYKLRELALAYKRTTGKILPFNLLVLDSAPGLPDFWRAITAFQTQLPSFFVIYYIGTFFVYLFMIIRFIWGHVTGFQPINGLVWDALNDTELIDVNAKRLYLYSKTDDMIDWHDIRLHGGEAKRNGYTVKAIEFPGSRHVAHVVVDKEKYWGAITEAWNNRDIKPIQNSSK